MAEIAISGLSPMGGKPDALDIIPFTDVSDTSQAPTGTTKKMTVTNLFTNPSMTTVVVASGGANITGNSAVIGTLGITSNTDVGGTLGVTGVATFGNNLSIPATSNLYLDGGSDTYLEETSANLVTIVTGAQNSFQVSATGCSILGSLALNTNKFTVASASGNTGIAGTLGVGTIAPATSAALEILSTTGALLVPRMTNTQRDALTPVNGMIIYSSTSNQLQGYVGGAWASLT